MSGAASDAVIEARDLVVARGARRVLDGASIAVARGEVVAIEGASGCGKTTLLRVLARLSEAESGSLRLEGRDAHELSPAAYRTRVAFVLQEAPMLEGTAADNVALGPGYRGVALARDAVEGLLRRVGLEGFADRRAVDLSGGEKQRVALARALANEPRVLLLDEPTSALDADNARRVLDLVRGLARDGLAVAMVTHTSAHAAAIADRRVVVRDGKVSPREETG